jgi:hypothetical protein
MAHNYVNTASKAVLDAPLNSSSNTITVTGFSGYPTVPFFALIDRDTSASELVEVTNVAGSTLTANRGAGGTASTSHSAGATLEHVIPASIPQSVEQHIEASTNVHGVTGALIGADSTATLSNKTFRGAHIHTYSDTLPDSPTGGFVTNADNSLGRDGFIANNTGANIDRRAFLLAQSGSPRFEVFYDGTVKATPSGVGSRPAIKAVGTVETDDLNVLDDVTVAGDVTAQGNMEASAGNFGNLNVSAGLSSTGSNSFGAMTAAGKITAAASGTGLTVNNAAEVGSLTVTGGNAVLSSSGAKVQFPSTVPSPTSPGTANGQVRFDGNVGLEIWDGAWFQAGGWGGFTTQGSFSTHQTAQSVTLVNTTLSNPYASGAPYFVLMQAQCEINNVSDGSTRFDLTLLTGSSTGTVWGIGLGNGFTQTNTSLAGPFTGSTPIFVCSKRNVGSGSCDITAFNQWFTFGIVPAGRLP